MHHTMNGERVHRIYLQFENLPRSIFSMLIFIQQIYNFHGENFMYYNDIQKHQLVYCIETYQSNPETPQPYCLHTEQNFCSLDFATKFSPNTAGSY